MKAVGLNCVWTVEAFLIKGEDVRPERILSDN